MWKVVLLESGEGLWKQRILKFVLYPLSYTLQKTLRWNRFCKV